MKILKVVSTIIVTILLLRFIYLLDMISFNLGNITEFGKYIPGYILGFVGGGINILLYKKSIGKKNVMLIASTVFCVFIAILDLLMMCVLNQI